MRNKLLLKIITSRVYIFQFSNLAAKSSLSNKTRLDRFSKITQVVDGAWDEVALVNQ